MRRACGMPRKIPIVAAFDITRSRRALNTKVGSRILPSVEFSSAASKAAMRWRTTAVETPAMDRCDCRGARLGDADPHMSGARTQRGKDLRGMYAASGLAHASRG